MATEKMAFRSFLTIKIGMSSVSFFKSRVRPSQIVLNTSPFFSSLEPERDIKIYNTNESKKYY